MFIDRFLHGLSGFAYDIAGYMGLTAKAYCDVETVDDEHTLVCRDGSLLSMIRLDGVGRMMTPDELQSLVVGLSTKLRSYLCHPGHDMQVVFSRDVEERAVRREISAAMAPSVATARRLNMDVEDLLAARGKKLERYCAIERGYLVVWTNPQAMTLMERRTASKETMAVRKDMPRAMEAQQLGLTIARLRETHASLRDTLMRDLSELDFIAEPLSAIEALTLMRTEVDAEWTADDWTPATPLNRPNLIPRAAWRGTSKSDMSALLWPPLVEQLIPRGVEPLSTRVVEIGRRLYMPMVLSLPPARVEPFDALFQRLRQAGIPYRVSFRLSGTGVEDNEIRVRSMLSYLSTSRLSRTALSEAMEDHRNGYVRMGFQLAACTWSDTGMEELMQSGARLARAIQGWGSCEVDDRLGNPVTPLLMTVPGMRRHSLGPLSVPPLEDAVKMLPIARPAMPWKDGSLMLRSDDGKLQPYQPYSSLQAAWVVLGYAPMGSGKSVMLNAFNMSLVTAPGLERLPRIGILDIGPSSSGFISLVRESLPPAQQHEVVYKRLRMVPEDSINPADTLLGMRGPMPLHRSFMINLLTLLATPVGQESAPDTIAHLASIVVDMAYTQFADSGEKVRRYAQNVDADVDRLIAERGIHFDTKTTWWELVDALFAAGEMHGATLAQRYASPLITDMAALARDPLVTQQFGGNAPTGEPITEYFYRAITLSVREYSILARATRLDLGAARIVSLDLADVAPKGSTNADRQTSVMYLLGRHILGRDLFLHEDDVRDAPMPQQYRDFHLRAAMNNQEDAKRLCFDEYHRTSSAPILRQQTMLDIREGRKAKLEMVVFSQILADFPEDMVDLATTVFILGAGQLTLQETVDTFRLSNHAGRILERLGKPSEAGAKMIGIFITSKGRFAHELVLTLSSTELWAYSSTSEDRALRDRLYSAIGAAETRRLLVRRYPSGTAIDEVERRRAVMAARGNLDGRAQQTLIDAMADEILKEYEMGGEDEAGLVSQVKRGVVV